MYGGTLTCLLLEFFYQREIEGKKRHTRINQRFVQPKYKIAKQKSKNTSLKHLEFWRNKNVISGFFFLVFGV